MKKALFTLLLFLLVYSYAQVTPGKLLDAWETLESEAVYENYLTEFNTQVQEAYKAYLARYESVGYETFVYFYSQNMSPDSSWYPGASCDKNVYTQDYCGERPLSVFANYSESDLETSLRTFDYCPELYDTYQRLATNNPSLSARVFLDTVFNQFTADPTLKAPLGDSQGLLKEVCTAFLGSYEQQVLLGLRLGFSDFVLDYFASFLRYSYITYDDSFDVPYHNPEFPSYNYSDSYWFYSNE
jgi:hypothetical protein